MEKEIDKNRLFGDGYIEAEDEEEYYRKHPEELDKKIEELKLKVGESASCEEEQVHEFKIYGYEAVEKIVASGNKSSARINVPNSWFGDTVMVVRIRKRYLF